MPSEHVGPRDVLDVVHGQNNLNNAQSLPPSTKNGCMSRIPVPAHHPSPDRIRAASPLPFPERAASPLPPNPPRFNSSTTMSSVSFGSSSIADTRKKQSKRDEAIRKKIESELSRKRTISMNHLQQRDKRKPTATKGTVAALKPSPALTVPERMTVSDACQLCAAKRTDCVLVVDDDEALSGIFTAKDLAYRVAAEALDPRSTPVSQIMTKNPMVTRDTTSATEALQLMVERHFRHLPVCNEEGNVVGLLDITKVFHEALEKVERSSSASEKLYSALAGVQTELGPGMSANPQAAAMMAYVDALREKTALPDLTTVMDSRTHPATVGPKTTVKEAARLMKEHRTTAVCVMENPGPNVPSRIAGIFTSKDVVLRVIAAGLEPGRCSVVRVMTPHPDVAPPTMTVQDALKKMHNGHYLNLPVVENDGRLVAIIDVLKLTYATLEQMNQMSVDAGGDNSGGPMWGRFFESLGHDDESAISGSNQQISELHTPPPYKDSPLKLGPDSPEVHPNDSASVVDEGSNLSFSHMRRGPQGLLSNMGGSASLTVPTLDDGKYSFKFKTPSGINHRLKAPHNIEELREAIAHKLVADPFFAAHLENPSGNEVGDAGDGQLESDGSAAAPIPDPHDFSILYVDKDGDQVVMTSDSDVTDAVHIAKNAGDDRVVLLLQGGKGWKHIVTQAEAKAAQINTAAKEEAPVPSEEKLEAAPSDGISTSSPPPPRVHVPASSDEVMGIPRDLLLPASIGALAVVIIAVFTISRLSD